MQPIRQIFRTAFLAFIALLMSGMALAIPFSRLDLNQPVIDQAEILSAPAKMEISKELRSWSDANLFQGAVVMVDNTDGEDIFDYAMKIVGKWKLGTAKDDNGLLIVVSKDDHKYFILTGEGLEGVLPDVSIKRIERNQMVPAFKQGDYDSGVENTLHAIATQLKADPEMRANMISADKKLAQHDDNLLAEVLPIALVFFFITLFLSHLIGRKKSAAVGSIGFFIAEIALFGVFIFAALVFAFIFFVAMNVIIGILSSQFNNHNDSNGGNGGSGISFPPIIGGGFGGGGFGSGGGGYNGGGGGFGGGGAGGSW